MLAAFGLSGPPVRLPGGSGGSWRTGDAVLKPVDAGEAELVWRTELFESLSGDGFRVARPVRALDGSVAVAGWTAARFVEGRHEPRWRDVIAVGELFHAALAGLSRPGFLDARTDPWSIGDRVAWGDLSVQSFGQVKHLERLAASLEPIGEPSQLVHGDLGGNVLFATGLPPAIIDFSPYWRPAGFASAIVVGDALTWEGADDSILDAVRHVPAFGQLLLRALIYRIVTDSILFPDAGPREDGADPYLPVVELAVRLARKGP